MKVQIVVPLSILVLFSVALALTLVADHEVSPQEPENSDIVVLYSSDDYQIEWGGNASNYAKTILTPVGESTPYFFAT
ncbi:MAG: hypothetical protein OEM52_03640 [bacterium]|nr:hypothetical protein [bacterium]